MTLPLIAALSAMLALVVFPPRAQQRVRLAEIRRTVRDRIGR